MGESSSVNWASRALVKSMGEKNNIRSKGDNQRSSTSTEDVPPMMVIQYGVKINIIRRISAKGQGQGQEVNKYNLNPRGLESFKKMD